jgi:hypothetical protein
VIVWYVCTTSRVRPPRGSSGLLSTIIMSVSLVRGNGGCAPGWGKRLAASSTCSAARTAAGSADDGGAWFMSATAPAGAILSSPAGSRTSGKLALVSPRQCSTTGGMLQSATAATPHTARTAPAGRLLHEGPFSLPLGSIPVATTGNNEERHFKIQLSASVTQNCTSCRLSSAHCFSRKHQFIDVLGKVERSSCSACGPVLLTVAKVTVTVKATHTNQ